MSAKFDPHAILHFRKENGQYAPGFSAIVDEIIPSDDNAVFLLDGDVVAELDDQEARIFEKDGSTKRITRVELSKEDPYVFTMPHKL